MDEYLKKSERCLCGFAFTLYMLVTCYKLTNAPLWLDETIEYWYSKVMFGKLPFEGAIANAATDMYQRIISTFQPPLYNFILYFWLKLGNGEWWFRFFGVAAGFLGMVAVYKTIKKIKNAYLASLAVIFCTFVYQLVYYWQECAEYCLMLGSLFWTIYFWFRLMERINPKNIILFTLSAILPIYSQYGAVFAVAGLILTAYGRVLLSRNKTCIITVCASCAAALIGFALPLYYLFVKKQMLNQQEGLVPETADWSAGLFQNMKESLETVFKWNFAPDFGGAAIKILVVILCAAVLIVLIMGKNKIIKTFAAVNIFTWLSYYFTVKTGIYAYGNFGNRYNLFLIPMWIILFFAVGIEIYQIMAERLSERAGTLKFYYAGICACLIFSLSFLSWNAKIQNNWGKENVRGAVEAWYLENAEMSNTLVYYAADSGFSYYVRNNGNYTEQTERNVNYMDWYRDKSQEEYLAYVKSVYGDTLPDEIYVVGSHTRGDFETLVNAISSEGYGREDIFSSGAYLVKMSRTEE